ncbi:Rossmann-like domain-containing protein [Thermosipho atlanticus]|uniref:Heavy-metal chelation n=1 Tax=Thermosipho atlanticus DSM 15807 TaxID=1123380 RepID=A0A1M5SNS6_9BACT|nr:DUF364 domain-containing protein [Thermosipho atlanticus]SHH40197.1 hypothetical protein SAMN02745199_0985 [Thermosipho atlanticus DSM 15807]
MSTITQKLFNEALKYVNGTTLEDFVIGVGLTAVKLSDGRAGVSYTNKGDTLGRCEEFYKCTGDTGNPQSKVKIGMKTEELLKIGLFSADPLLRSVAYAALNATFSVPEIKKMYKKGDISKFLGVSFEDIVGMIGEITPLINLWKPLVWDILIFDRNRKNEEVFPDWAVVDFLPKCTVVVITGSAVTNGSIDWVLKYVNTERIAIIGPSTPLTPNVFNVKILAGVEVVDPDKLFDLVSKGAGTKKIIAEKAVEKVVLIKE